MIFHSNNHCILGIQLFINAWQYIYCAQIIKVGPNLLAKSYAWSVIIYPEHASKFLRNFNEPNSQQFILTIFFFLIGRQYTFFNGSVPDPSNSTNDVNLNLPANRI